MLKQSFIGYCFDSEQQKITAKVRDREDALASTRDAWATQTSFLLTHRKNANAARVAMIDAIAVANAAVQADLR
jgi:hypothetical protein